MRLVDIVRGLRETELIYWSDSYLRTFQAAVLRVEKEKKRRVYIVLDRTGFHPKSGGQPSDTGTIHNKNFAVKINKAMFTRGVVVHWGKLLEGSPEEGTTITGEISWEPRYLFMRRHTAGHLLDHCLTEVCGGSVETTDSWLGDPCYVGYKGKPPSGELVKGAEVLCNRMIAEGASVRVEVVSHEELLRRAPEAPNIYRLPQLDSYRVVTIEGCDPIPCGGCHLKNVKEIRRFSIRDVVPAENGYRVYYDVA
ncbi:MAG: alanine--tRNA ligase-related protein [Candidatus Bathyarchaeia archaeon]